MKGREITKSSSSASSTDFLVCFPSRAHLALLSKPVSSPVRLLQLPEPNSRPSRHQPPPQQSLRRHKKSGTYRRPQASPVPWSNRKQMGSGSSATSEPTSPKVTCAGQIKVRHKAGAGRSWQSVMAEIEKIHDGKTKKRGESSSMLGFSKEIMQFLTCLKNVKFNFRCFGSSSFPEITSDDDDEDDDEEEDDKESNKYDENGAVFSKWFMVLKENQNFPANGEDGNRKSSQRGGSWDEGSFAAAAAAVPPANALLLMRCRSAPAKSWLEEKEEEERVAMEKENDGVENNKLMMEKKNILKLLMDEEKREEKEEEDRKRKQSMFLEGYDTDYYNISTDVAKETWVVGATAMTGSLIRCPSTKR